MSEPFAVEAKYDGLVLYLAGEEWGRLSLEEVLALKELVGTQEWDQEIMKASQCRDEYKYRKIAELEEELRKLKGVDEDARA